MKKSSNKNIISFILLIVIAIICFIVIDFMRKDHKTKPANLDLVDQLNLELIENRFGVALFGIPDTEIKDFSTISDSMKLYMTTLGNGFRFDHYSAENKTEQCGGYSLGFFTQQFQLLFGKKLKIGQLEHFKELESMEHVRERKTYDITKFTYQKENQIFVANQCSDVKTNDRVFYKWSTIKTEKDRFIVTAKALFGSYEDANNKLIMYKDSSHKEQLTEFPTLKTSQNGDYTINQNSDNMTVTDYFNQSYYYQYTFSNDGNYYLQKYIRIK